MRVRANGIDIEVEDSGGQGPAVLLVMGLGMQLTAWPEVFVQRLREAGYRVLRHDNRDVGLSQYFDDCPTPHLLWQWARQKFGLQVRSTYTLHDMALDALGVLDALGIAQAHVIGVSMGGMIAQRMAIAAPQRLLSLVSIMSSSGARQLPPARADVAAALMRRPPSHDHDALVAHALALVRLIASPGFAFDEDRARARIAAALVRAHHPAGVIRQMLAIGADTDLRAAALGQVQTPTLVVHGDADPLVPLACGVDTARRIPNARLESIPGMGHDLPEAALPILLGHILPFLQSVDAVAHR